ncbi:MAG: cytidylate kinase-like family protein [Clostridia bacterium]|nr:cytidylate kinase-like family protein [Clostridia bacterium]
MNRIITIGREFGSGGREIGRRLAEKLGYAYYDNEIITEISKKTELSEKYVQSVIERKPLISYPIHIGGTFYTLPSVQLEQSTMIYKEQCNILKEMADRSDCIVVGRCGDHILRDYSPTRIFVYADMASKIQRCRLKGGEDEKLSDNELKKKITSVDKHRAEYYNFYTGKKWGDKSNYDLCINTTDKDVKDIVERLAKFVL